MRELPLIRGNESARIESVKEDVVVDPTGKARLHVDADGARVGLAAFRKQSFELGKCFGGGIHPHVVHDFCRPDARVSRGNGAGGSFEPLPAPGEIAAQLVVGKVGVCRLTMEAHLPGIRRIVDEIRRHLGLPDEQLRIQRAGVGEALRLFQGAQFLQKRREACVRSRPLLVFRVQSGNRRRRFGFCCCAFLRLLRRACLEIFSCL